jgi:ATP-dependent DNA ligase
LPSTSSTQTRAISEAVCSSSPHVLVELVDGAEMILPCRRLPDDGAEGSRLVEERGYEGFVAKDPTLTYRADPTSAWVNVKVRHEGVFIVGGIRDVDAFDGVLVGERVDDGLEYRGLVEWGYRAADVLELLREVRMFRSDSRGRLGVAKRAGFTQADLAAKLGAAPNSVARSERNERAIAEPMARRIRMTLEPTKPKRRGA